MNFSTLLLSLILAILSKTMDCNRVKGVKTSNYGLIGSSLNTWKFRLNSLSKNKVTNVNIAFTFALKWPKLVNIIVSDSSYKLRYYTESEIWYFSLTKLTNIEYELTFYAPINEGHLLIYEVDNPIKFDYNQLINNPVKFKHLILRRYKSYIATDKKTNERKMIFVEHKESVGGENEINKTLIIAISLICLIFVIMIASILFCCYCHKKSTQFSEPHVNVNIQYPQMKWQSHNSSGNESIIFQNTKLNSPHNYQNRLENNHLYMNNSMISSSRNPNDHLYMNNSMNNSLNNSSRNPNDQLFNSPNNVYVNQTMFNPTHT